MSDREERFVMDKRLKEQFLSKWGDILTQQTGIDYESFKREPFYITADSIGTEKTSIAFFNTSNHRAKVMGPASDKRMQENKHPRSIYHHSLYITVERCSTDEISTYNPSNEAHPLQSSNNTNARLQSLPNSCNVITSSESTRNRKRSRPSVSHAATQTYDIRREHFPSDEAWLFYLELVRRLNQKIIDTPDSPHREARVYYLRGIIERMTEKVLDMQRFIC